MSSNMCNVFTLGLGLIKEMNIDDRDVITVNNFKDLDLSATRRSHRSGVGVIYNDHGTIKIVVKKIGQTPITHPFDNNVEKIRLIKILRFDYDWAEKEISGATGIPIPRVSDMSLQKEEDVIRLAEKIRQTKKRKAMLASNYLNPNIKLKNKKRKTSKKEDDNNELRN